MKQGPYNYEQTQFKEQIITAQLATSVYYHECRDWHCS